MIRISNGAARFTTSRPMLPRPMIPSVFPRSSLPRNFFFSHLPDLVERLACGIARAIPNISAMVCSATETALPPGVFITSTPAAVAAGRSTLSTPTPARPITFSFGAFARTSGVTLTALRTRRASQVGKCAAYSLGFETTTSQPACAFNNSMPAGASGSATSIFMLEIGGSHGRGNFVLLQTSYFRVYVLHGRDAFAELNGHSIGGEDNLQLSDDGERVAEIEVTEMGNTEDLAFHAALAVGDDGAEPVAVVLHDD